MQKQYNKISQYKSHSYNSMKSYQFCLVLALTLALCNAYSNTTDFWASELNDSKLNFNAYAGYEDINWYYPTGKASIYYHLFSASGHNIFNTSDVAPIIVWLQGGPGASSQFGAFTQIGPVRIVNGKVQRGSNSWNIIGHLLFIDSPLNVGFSYFGDRKGKTQVSDTNTATDHLINFLYNFFTKDFPTLKGSPVYLAGESFAGHYLPNLARKIYMNSSFITSAGFNLQGVMIGDGWTDPINQVNFYDSYLWSVGVVQKKFRDVCTWFQTQALINIYQGKYSTATDFFDYLTNNDTTPEAYMGNISMFNFRNYNGLDESFATYVNKNKDKLYGQVDFIPGNDAVYAAFANDVSRSYATDVRIILGYGKVLIFNGQNDVVVNTAGVLQYLNSLSWSGINAWKNTNKIIWTLLGETKGWVKASGNLTFALVNNAGHMVPSDQPEAAFSLIGHFIRNDNDWKN